MPVSKLHVFLFRKSVKRSDLSKKNGVGKLAFVNLKPDLNSWNKGELPNANFQKISKWKNLSNQQPKGLNQKL